VIEVYQIFSHKNLFSSTVLMRQSASRSVRGPTVQWERSNS